MTKRLLTIISGQPLPNYIAISEPVTRPDIVHCIYTPGQSGMNERLRALKGVVGKNFPDVKFELHPVADAYDSAAVWKTGFDLLTTFAKDDWSLNRTAGTEQMRAPLTEAFKMAGREATFFVETEKDQITFAKQGWLRDARPFQGRIDVTDYFALHGQTVAGAKGQAVNWTEKDMFRRLETLAFDDVVPNCKWFGAINKDLIAEYDAVCTASYRLYVFERKRFRSFATATADMEEKERKSAQKRQANDIKHDMEKLAYTRAIFGGPFGKVYWVFDGSYQIAEGVLDRFRVLGINVIRGADASKFSEFPEKLGLPPRIHGRRTSKTFRDSL